ncbi:MULTISPECIES: peptide ABC transporter substrate-binding protein [Aerococcus]|uniref:peptide ABC transporter substrate-binding protein n=1 Tax=Aerococcus urinae (strain CCUG 59500 / ACS-120-V-Col10a) TaxID=2976812 RepID=UPI000200E7C8|nr:peptide ABC transporter substrate-binding protein [Aerococcus sp. Group 1]AEA01869.1 ABC transporter, substrate-binding protein, family 5 [Aerococcus sp. Group 1]MCY3030017.1 peptide ABC transporter substrate-binding protein [Aerococcus sp. Group 1]MCY3054776.1 peptide ABC transporter substrate-binding protein [Aerococcus sp. Group 1]MCY3056506.1 peptide ABC transporter substrate-binding protein [Aerococcus sp. Group 1]MCY3061185.1 peptide ABC transporter substrate-binding protein [Aerococc
MRSLLKALLTSLLCLFLIACQADNLSSTDKDQEVSLPEEWVHFPSKYPLTTMDNQKANDITSLTYCSQVFDGLYWQDENNDLQANLAQDFPEISADGLTYTINLRQDAKWVNGQPVTAHDFVYSFRRLVNPETAAPYANLAEGIKGAKAIQSGQAPLDQLGVEALGDYQLQIQLDYPNPNFTKLLAFTPFYPVNEDYVTAQGDQYGQDSDHVLGNGPFVIKNWQAGQDHWDLQKNDQYNRQDLAIDGVKVQVIKEENTGVNLFESGQLDQMPLHGQIAKNYQAKGEGDLQVKAWTDYLEFNHQSPDLSQVDLRRAIAYAIDSRAVEELIGGGARALTSFVPSQLVVDPVTGEDITDSPAMDTWYDLDQAHEAFDRYKAANHKQTLTLTLLANDDENSRKLSEYLKETLEQALDGLSIDLQNVPKKNRIDRMNRQDFDFALTAWGADYDDPLAYYQNLKSDNSFNRGRYQNPELDRLITDLAFPYNQDRDRPYQVALKIEELIKDQAVVVPLYQKNEWHLRSDRVQGVIYRPIGPEVDFRLASIQSN